MYCLYTDYKSYNTIYIFKNYFIIIFLIFNFSTDKFNPYGLFELEKGYSGFKSSFGQVKKQDLEVQSVKNVSQRGD